MSKWSRARWPGECTGCWDAIEVDDSIYLDGDSVLCQDCGEAEEADGPEKEQDDD